MISEKGIELVILLTLIDKITKPVDSEGHNC